MAPKANWIDDVISEVSHVETPRSWLYWSLLCAISASASNNYTLYALKGVLPYKPNLYVMLMGESGLGKGFGVHLAKLLVQEADVTRVIMGRASIQAIINEMSKQKSRADGKEPLKDSRAFLVNGELTAAFISDPDALGILTDLYDGHYNPKWENILKTSGKETLKHPCVTTLFGTSPAHFYDKIPEANIQGGYIGRNLIVFEQLRFQNVDLLEDSNDINDQLGEVVIPRYHKHLVKLAGESGRIIPEKNAIELFNTWRRGWRKNPIPDKTGFINRVPDHVLKVAMCLSLSRYDFIGFIEEADMELAISHVTNLVKGNKVTTAGRGIDPLASQGRLIVELFLGEKRSYSRSETLQMGHGDFDGPTLDRIMESLLDMRWFTRKRIGAGENADWEFEIQPKALDFYGRGRVK